MANDDQLKQYLANNMAETTFDGIFNRTVIKWSLCIKHLQRLVLLAGYKNISVPPMPLQTHQVAVHTQYQYAAAIVTYKLTDKEYTQELIEYVKYICRDNLSDLITMAIKWVASIRYARQVDNVPLYAVNCLPGFRMVYNMHAGPNSPLVLGITCDIPNPETLLGLLCLYPKFTFGKFSLPDSTN